MEPVFCVVAEELGVLARRLGSAWFRVDLTADEQRVVHAERESHPDAHVRRKMLVIRSLHGGLKRAQAAKLAGVGLATVGRYVAAYRDGGLDGLRQGNVQGPVSDWASSREAIRESFERQPDCTIGEACVRIEQLTGLRRGQTQVRRFLKGLGLKWQRIRAIPVPPKKNLAEHVAEQAVFYDVELKPRLDATLAGQGHVFFVDAAHFMFGTFLCCLWLFARIFVRAASGRQQMGSARPLSVTPSSGELSNSMAAMLLGAQALTPGFLARIIVQHSSRDEDRYCIEEQTGTCREDNRV